MAPRLPHLRHAPVSLLALLVAMRVLIPGLHGLQHVAASTGTPDPCCSQHECEDPVEEEDGVEQSCALCDLILTFQAAPEVELAPDRAPILDQCGWVAETGSQSGSESRDRKRRARAPPRKSTLQ